MRYVSHATSLRIIRLALAFPHRAVIWGALREGYECVVIFSFMQFMMIYLGGAKKLHRILTAERTHHVGPMKVCFSQWTGAHFVRMTLRGVLQYVERDFARMCSSFCAKVVQEGV